MKLYEFEQETEYIIILRHLNHSLLMQIKLILLNHHYLEDLKDAD